MPRNSPKTCTSSKVPGVVRNGAAGEKETTKKRKIGHQEAFEGAICIIGRFGLMLWSISAGASCSSTSSGSEVFLPAGAPHEISPMFLYCAGTAPANVKQKNKKSKMLMTFVGKSFVWETQPQCCAFAPLRHPRVHTCIGFVRMTVLLRASPEYTGRGHLRTDRVRRAVLR